MSTIVSLLLFCVLTLILSPLSVYVPVLLRINPILLVLLWRLFHPNKFSIGVLLFWLFVIQIQTPLLPWGSLMVLGMFVITLFQIIQRNYLEHRRLSSFILLIALTSILWDNLIMIVTIIWASVGGLPSPWVGIANAEKTILFNALGMTVCLCVLVGVESKIQQETIADTLRRYYEHLHRPHFRSSNTAIR